MSEYRIDVTVLREPGQTALIEAYRQRDRSRCSFDDFAAGFVAALQHLGAYNKYRLDQTAGAAEQPGWIRVHR